MERILKTILYSPKIESNVCCINSIHHFRKNVKYVPFLNMHTKVRYDQRHMPFAVALRIKKLRCILFLYLLFITHTQTTIFLLVLIANFEAKCKIKYFREQCQHHQSHFLLYQTFLSIFLSYPILVW